MGPEPGSAEEDRIRRAQAGDREAFSLLVAENMRGVYGFAFRMTGNRADADDVAQQTFVNAFRKLDRFVAGTNFRAWLFAIAGNLCTDLHRKKTVRREVELAPEGALAPAGEEDPVSAAIRREDSRLVWDALENLPPEQRAVLILHGMEDISLADLARSMDCPEGTVRWRYFQARHRLREVLERRERGKGGIPWTT